MIDSFKVLKYKDYEMQINIIIDIWYVYFLYLEKCFLIFVSINKVCKKF